MFTFGSDPEFPLYYRGEPISAINILPKKTNQLPHQGSGFYYDNVLAECAIKPGETKEEVLENIHDALKFLSEAVQPATPMICAAQDYPTSQLINPIAREAGCKPEWCVYRMKLLKPIASIITNTPLRTAGGHIHLGAKEGVLHNEFYLPPLVMMMDLFLGLPSIFIDQDPTSPIRRKAYGLAGRHRVPRHGDNFGLEYRVLGNFWFASPKLVALIYDLTEFVIQFVQDDGFLKLWKIDQEKLRGDDPSTAYECVAYNVAALRNCIDTSDRSAIKRQFEGLMAEYLPANLRTRINDLMHEKFDPLAKEWGL